MGSERSYWIRLICHWVNVRKRNGLSIPFILGTSTLINSDFKIRDTSVSDLLNEIKNSYNEEILVLEYCPDIGEYILGLSNPNNPKSGLKIKNEKTDKTKIIATYSTVLLGKTFEDIKKSLTSKYKDCLTQENFSIINFKWTKFSDNDLKMIDEALKT